LQQQTVRDRNRSDHCLSSTAYHHYGERTVSTARQSDYEEDSALTTTAIRNAEWAIAWDEAAGHHVYRRDVDIAFADDRIVFVGRNYAGRRTG
jgi:hypothetical protein